MITIKVYDLEFRMLRNGIVEVKSDKRGWDWGIRSAREFGFTDSHIGAIRHIIANARGLFPEEPPVVPKVEPLKPVERKPLEPV
jgi:hypothetical protein